jgi:tight adherence protein C
MSGVLFAAAVGCAGLASLAAGLLVARRMRLSRARDPAAHIRLPLVMRLVFPLACILEPVAGCLVSGRRLENTGRQLETLGLGSQLTPLAWESARIALALVPVIAACMAKGATAWLFLGLAVAGYGSGGVWLRRQREKLHRRVVRELPVWLDLMTVCVEAGATLSSGLRLIVSQAPDSPLREYFDRVLREVRGGRARAQAFSHVAEIYDIETLTTLASAISHAEGSGMSLGQVLRTQAEQRTAERFARAEKLAMQAPVKMLGPLILCIFPCTFIVIGVPIAVRLKEALFP